MSAERGGKLRQPADVQPLEWNSRDEFARVRAEWLELVRWDISLAPASFRVVSEIAGRLGYDRSEAWPSIPWLAASLHMSVATIKRCLAQAVERGWLARERRGFGGSNRYTMSISAKVAEAVCASRDIRLEMLAEARRDRSIELTGEPNGEALH